MSNLTNLNRDMAWIVPDQPGASLGTEDPAAVTVGLDGVVYDKIGFLHFSTAALTHSNPRLVGVAMLPPTEEAIPYRVKTEISFTGDATAILGLGFLRDPVVSGDNIMSSAQYYGFPASAIVDDIWCIRPSSIEAGNPLCIFMGIQAANAAQAAAKMTVQRLTSKPDNFQTANF